MNMMRMLFGLIGWVLVCCPAGAVYATLPDATEHCQVCLDYYEQLDRMTRQARVRISPQFKVPGFPYLRTNRFLTAIGPKLASEAERRQWVERMMQLDLTARVKEIRNLPPKDRSRLRTQLAPVFARVDLFKSLHDCARRLLAADRLQPDFYQAVRNALPQPTEYSLWRRILGVYPLASLPVRFLTLKVRREFAPWFKQPWSELAQQGALKVYAPPASNEPFEQLAEELFRDAPRDAMGLPLLTPAQQRQLFAALAPVIYQDTTTGLDRFGRVHWKGHELAIDTVQPVVYFYPSHAFYKRHAIVQLNYAFWYPARQGAAAPWIEWGQLDGLTIRISLDQHGWPLMVDTMNNCGCYHLLAPQRERIERQRSQTGRIDPFVPQWLPEHFPARRLAVSVLSGWHQVQQLSARKAPPGAEVYQLVPYDQLESLPRPAGQAASMFNESGLATGSGRVEPLLLFSMGIPAVGSMRQRGHHAIEFIGRAHFDEPDLLKRYFVFR